MLKTLVRNLGSVNAENVTGHLYVTSPGVTVTCPEASFGTIPAQDSGWNLTGFGVRLDPGLPDDYPVVCSLVCTDGSDASWTVHFELRAYEAVMLYVDCEIDDAGSSWPNGRLDPGETAQLAIRITNVGLGNRFEVCGALRSIDTIMAVNDTDAVFGTVLAGDTVQTTDHFSITALPGMTPGVELPCLLRITGDHGYDVTLEFGLVTGQIVLTDPIPDGPRTPPKYFAYDDGDVFYTELPEFDWVEIRGTGTRLDLEDQQTVTIPLPENFGPFVFYDQSFEEISICSNGWFAPGRTIDRAWQNRELPTNRHRALIAPLWDDLYPPSGGGVLCYHDAANHRFVIEYDSVHYSGARSEWDKFQVVIYDATRAAQDGNSVFCFQYRTANYVGSATIGEQDGADVPAGIGALFDGTYHAGCMPIAPGRCIKFTTNPPQLVGVEEPGAAVAVHKGRRLSVAPNPFTGRALISYSLDKGANVNLGVFDASGRSVRTLASGGRAAGEYAVAWDGRDDAGNELAHGIYFVRLTSPGSMVQTKTILAR